MGYYMEGLIESCILYAFINRKYKERVYLYMR